MRAPALAAVRGAPMSGSGFRGVSAAQDGRFADKERKLLKSTKFPESFNTRVDMAKVQLEVIRPWIHQELEKYLGVEDDILKGYVESQLEAKPLDPKQMQLSLTGFLEKNASAFMRDLWDLLLSAQANKTGIPKVFLDRKNDELRQKKEQEAELEAAMKAKRDQMEEATRRLDEERLRQAALAAHATQKLEERMHERQQLERQEPPPADKPTLPSPPHGTAATAASTADERRADREREDRPRHHQRRGRGRRDDDYDRDRRRDRRRRDDEYDRDRRRDRRRDDDDDYRCDRRDYDRRDYEYDRRDRDYDRDHDRRDRRDDYRYDRRDRRDEPRGHYDRRERERRDVDEQDEFGRSRPPRRDEVERAAAPSGGGDNDEHRANADVDAPKPDGAAPMNAEAPAAAAGVPGED